MDKRPHLALLWHGDREARNKASFEGNRFQRLAEALRAVGVEAVPVVYNDDFAAEVKEQLLGMDGVLVWVNPIEQGRDRSMLDNVLEQVAEQGVFVSAHPEIIQKMGTKKVLVRTRDMSWGADTYWYASLQELGEQLPVRLREGKARVLKQYRGNGGNGIWKVERHPEDKGRVRVRHALRGSVEEDISFDEFLARCEPYFIGEGGMIDQAYQDRLTDGMVRCYLVQDKVVGFGHQSINLLFPAPPGQPSTEAPLPSQRLYYPPATPDFQAIKRKMEEEWLNALYQTLDLDAKSLPLIWDADFLYGPRTASGEDTYVLCEINVSSVHPFPDSALEPLAQATKNEVLLRAR